MPNRKISYISESDLIQELFKAAVKQDSDYVPIATVAPFDFNKNLEDIQAALYSAMFGDYGKEPKYRYKDLEKFERYEDAQAEEFTPILIKVVSNTNVMLCDYMSDYGKIVNFVLYWDGKELRCYIPNKGNTYSPKNDEEDEDEDEEIENEDENPVINEEIFWGEVEKRFKE